MEKIRKIFEVIIHDKPYDVYDIPERDHAGLNDMPKTWWVYYGERLPEGLFPAILSTEFEPFCVGINRSLWDIRFTQHNSSKEKWGSTNFRNNTYCEMKCNGKIVYAFRTMGGERGLSYAFAKVQYLQTKLAEHPFNFFNPEKENGRKIYFYGLPATVRVAPHEAWEISIIPDYSAMERPEWWKEYKRRTSKIGEKDSEWREIENSDTADYQASDRINWGDALSDGNIWWFRD